MDLVSYKMDSKDIIKKRLKITKDVEREIKEVQKILSSSEPEEVKFDSIRAIFLELANEIVKAQTEKIFDDRTGFLNPTYGEHILAQEIELAHRYKKGFTIALLDIDQLKKINDTLGHVVGTKVIMWVAAVIKKSIRKPDIVVRYGGDEFLIIFINTEPPRAQEAIKRIIRNLDQANDIIPGRKISLSTGLAYYSGNKKISPEKMIAEADKKLYENKRKRKLE